MAHQDEVSRHRIFDEQGVRVMEAMCPTCVFRPGNVMKLAPGRLAGMIEDAKRDESTIVCHDTLDDQYQAACRGFFDRHATQALQIAERLGYILWWSRAMNVATVQPHDDGRSNQPPPAL